MTAQEQVLRHIEQGHFATIGEYRFSSGEMLNWRDKQTGQARSAPIYRHTVEVGSAAITVSEPLPPSVQKLEDIPPAKHKKGDTVILIITELSRDRGLVTCRGNLEGLENHQSPGTSAPVSGGKVR